MKKKRPVALLLALCLTVGLTGGCASRAKITEDMVPTVTDLHMDDQLSAEVEEEVVPEVLGLMMNTSYLSELTRLDGDNTQVAGVEVKEIDIVMKATSVDKDLKIKFVNEKNGRVVTGTAFEVEVTDKDKKTKEYKDEDKDGIIHIKEINGGSYKVAMKEIQGFHGGDAITATVKGQIEYAVVDVTDEIKKESEINVSKEDGAYGGGNVDESTNESAAPVLTDTVEFVASSKTPIYDTQTKVQKKDAFGQLMYTKQQVDKYGTPMYAKILSEPAADHVDENPKDEKCDRCGASLHVHKYSEELKEVTAATCTTEGKKAQVCSCGAVKEDSSAKTEVIPALGHVDENNDAKCDREGCGADVSSAHTHKYETQTTLVEPTCAAAGKSAMKCACGAVDEEHSTEIPARSHKDEDQNGTCDYTDCGAALNTSSEAQNPAGQSEPTARLFAGKFTLLTAAPTVTDKIVYDTSSAPVYDTTSDPVYEEPKITGYKYTGWQTIDGKTYYYDKNGNRVTGTQVIQGVQYTFEAGGNRSGVIGIDVSKYQTSIDWNQVKNAGIEFVMVRCGYRGYGSGVLVEDPKFRSHVAGAKAAGLKVGLYFFSQAITEAEAVEEASMAVSLARSVGGITLPIAIDSEYAAGGAGRADGLNKADRTKITKAFCNTIANSGYTPMVYASKSWFSSHLDVSALGSYRIWVAHYAAQCGYTGRYDIWQYTSKGSVAGIKGNVDMNISYM